MNPTGQPQGQTPSSAPIFADPQAAGAQTGPTPTAPGAAQAEQETVRGESGLPDAAEHQRRVEENVRAAREKAAATDTPGGRVREYQDNRSKAAEAKAGEGDQAPPAFSHGFAAPAPAADAAFESHRRELVGAGVPGHHVDEARRKGIDPAGLLKVVQDYRQRAPEAPELIRRVIALLPEPKKG